MMSENAQSSGGDDFFYSNGKPSCSIFDYSLFTPVDGKPLLLLAGKFYTPC